LNALFYRDIAIAPLAHFASETLVPLCLLSMSIALATLAFRRSDLFSKPAHQALIAFIALIVLCAVSHLLTTWVGAGTNVVAASQFAVVALAMASATLAWFILPVALRLPTETDLERVNETLILRIQERDTALVVARNTNQLLLVAEEIAQAGHWRVDDTGRLCVWSHGLRRIFGFPDNASLPDLRDCPYHEDDRTRVLGAFEEAVKTGASVDIEARVIRPDGSQRTIILRSTTGGGRSEFALQFGVVIDITELTDTVTQLRLRERQLRAILDNTPALIGYWDAQMQNRIANHMYAEWFGRDPTQMLGQYMEDVIGERAFKANWSYIEGALSGSSQQFEQTIKRANKSDRYVLTSYVPDQRNGAVEGFYVLIIDITDRRLSEERLWASEAFLDRIGRVAGIGGWELDLSSGTLQWSDRTRQLHEVATDFEPTMETAIAFYAHEAQPIVRQAYDAAITQGQSWDLELPLLTANGRHLWVRFAGETEAVDGAAKRVFGVFQDITARKQIESEHEARRILLDKARTTAEIAQREAEQASRDKSDLLATMSHEVRTPLNAIVGFTDLLLRHTELGEDVYDTLKMFQASSSALLRVVDDALDFSMIEAGKLVLVPEPFSPRELVQEAIAMVAAQAAGKGLEIQQQIAEIVPRNLIGDAVRIRQVLLNFLINAVKFSSRGAIVIGVETLGGTELGTSLLFTVKDDGIGFPEHKHDMLFNRFSQVDGSIRRRFGGTGLGLAISKSLVEAMGGTIGARSFEGQGSTFWFALALPEAQDGVDAKPQPLAAVTRLRILVVDDVPINLELARRILSSAGHSVDVVETGQDAIVYVQRQNYDLVLMDIQMPEMDGITATKHIRRLSHRNHLVPIFAMTANVLPGQVEMFRAAGLDGHIGKPLKQSVLDKTIEQVSKQRAHLAAIGGSLRHEDDELLGRLWDHQRSGSGGEAFGALLGQFLHVLKEQFYDSLDTLTRADLAERMHDIGAAAGSLGLMKFQELCRQLEAACVAETESKGLQEAFAKARLAIIAKIEAQAATF
jgi:PAS domain S-box-containing protein